MKYFPGSITVVERVKTPYKEIPLPRFEIDRLSDGRYVFNLKAANGASVIFSEHYRHYHSCRNGIYYLRQGVVPEFYLDENLEHRYRFISSNGRVLAHSKAYKSKGACSRSLNVTFALIGTAAIE